MRLQLLIADHFDTLANGKVVALGLFTDRVVVMNLPADMAAPTVEMPFGLDLGLLLTLSDTVLNGADAEVSIHPPGGLPSVAVIRMAGLSVNPGASANLLTKLQPLIIPCPGVYEVQVKVGGQVMTDSFEVRIVPLPAATAAQPVATLPARPTKQPAAKAARAKATRAP